MDRGACRAIAHRVAKSWKRPSDLHFPYFGAVFKICPQLLWALSSLLKTEVLSTGSHVIFFSGLLPHFGKAHSF